jgi:Rrf2 family protein
MLKLSKKVEYGLLAVKHIASQGGGDVLTAKEISDRYQIPFELLSKILQKLAKEKIITSYQGVKGGYSLVSNPADLKISQIINAIEGPTSLMECGSETESCCEQFHNCTIRNPLQKIQVNINDVFDNMTLKEII